MEYVFLQGAVYISTHADAYDSLPIRTRYQA